MFQVFGIYNIVGTKGARKKYFPPLRFLILQHARVSKGQLGRFTQKSNNSCLSYTASWQVGDRVCKSLLSHVFQYPFAGNVSLRKLNANEQTRSVSLKCSLSYTVPYCRIILISKERKEMRKIHIRGSILSVKKHFQQVENWNA